MKTIIAKVQIQFDQYTEGSSETYTAETINKINGILQREFNDICPIIYGNNIDSSDIEVSSELTIMGEFVNDGSEYEILDYVLKTFNTEDGFTNIEVRNYDDELVYEIAGVEMIDEYSDDEEILKFEEVVKTILIGEGLI